jgi:DNA-binding response OmpR family regulator
MIRTVLIVDDERDLAATCQRLLGRRGWDVVLAASREAAVTVLGRHPRPVLTIVDRQLPDGDGFDVLRVARAAGIPVLMVTGYGTAATRRLALEEGAAGFLAKPFSGHDLVELVRTIVGEPSDSPAPPAIVRPSPTPPRPGVHC